jgi:CDP-diacylglycerol---glycerol-3-phosphate 3-phosphatidyltransferase
MTNFVFLNERNRERYLKLINPVGRLMARLRIHPNILSFTGLILSAAAGLVYGAGSFFWGAWLAVLAGTCDALDGQLARETKKASPFGAFLDSTLDRFGEMFIFLGLAWHFSGGILFFKDNVVNPTGFQSPLAVALIILAITGSFMVSYTKARAEGLGVDCKVGWMQRPERMTLLIIGSLLAAIPVIGLFVMKLTLLLLAALSNFTAIHRMVYVRNELLKKTHAP